MERVEGVQINIGKREMGDILGRKQRRRGS
jgi:hypothetical protein